jgi:outer membrane protein, heavy metal efflux system
MHYPQTRIRLFFVSGFKSGLLLLALAASLVFLPVAAQETEGLTSEELIQDILQLNPGLAAQRLEALARNEEIVNAGALDDPRVSYSVAPATIGQNIPSALGNALGVRQVIQLSQNIPWAGKRQLRTELAQAQSAAAHFSTDDLQLQLIAAGRLHWASWWDVHQALTINREQQRLLTELENVIETQYASGAGLQQDLLQVQTAQIRADHRGIVLEQQLERIRARINALRNRPAIAEIAAAQGEPRPPALPSEEILRNWLEQAHPALQSARADVDAARADRALTYKNDYPDVQVNVGYNELWNASDLRLQVGVSVNIPLDFGKRSARKAASDYRYNSAQSDINYLRNQLLSELAQQLSWAREAHHAIELARDQLIPKATQTLAASQSDYQQGIADFSNVIQAEQTLLEARLLLSNSLASQYQAHAEIDRLVGGQLWPLDPASL